MQRHLDIEKFIPQVGCHDNPDQGMCIMEAVAFVAGEPHSDKPKCACPVIAAFMRVFNDSIRDDDRRKELLNPYIYRLASTKATPDIEKRRSFMALDWLIREFLPAWLRLVPSLEKHAAAIAALPEINNMATATQAGELIARAASDSVAAWDAAWDAEWATARDAAWYAVRTTARDAAWYAVRAAAGDAARYAAWYAVWDVARDATGAAAWAAAGAAAWAAAGAAARDAAGGALLPTALSLQQSACGLLDRMIAAA